jgi:hypothetical protein
LRDIPKWYRDKFGIKSLKPGTTTQKAGENNKAGDRGSQKAGSAANQCVRKNMHSTSRWRQFTEAELEATTPTDLRRASKGSSVEIGDPNSNIPSENLLPDCPVLGTANAAQQTLPSNPPPSTKQTDHVADPKMSTSTSLKTNTAPQNGNSEQSSIQISAVQKATPRSSGASTPGSGSAVPLAQRQRRRHRPSRTSQSRLPADTLEPTMTGSLPRLQIPPNQILDKIPASAATARITDTPSAHVNPSASGVKKSSAALDTDKTENNVRAAKKNSQTETGKETQSGVINSVDKQRTIGTVLQPGAETDIFGLGIYD